MTNFSLSRSVTISVPVPTVHGLINDLREWEHWSPWQEADPNVTQTYSGPTRGVGVAMHWI